MMFAMKKAFASCGGIRILQVGALDAEHLREIFCNLDRPRPGEISNRSSSGGIVFAIVVTVTITDVLERAAEMDSAGRYELFLICGSHDLGALPRIGGRVRPVAIYCPVCLTVFSGTTHRMLNRPCPDLVVDDGRYSAS
jgi:hypothetical protein